MRIDELTRKDFINNVDNRTKRYSKKVKGVRYIGITSDYVIHMGVTSVTASPSTEYLVKIKLLDYPKIQDSKDLSTEDKVRLSIDGDIKVSCTCTAYKYWGYKYIMTQLSSNEDSNEDRFPTIRNPKLEGTLCKHSMIALRGFGKWWKKISYDIDNRNFI